MINNKIILGKNIKRLREEFGLTQEEFAEKIKLSPQTVSLIEAGKYFTTAETLDNICNTFEIKPSILFELDAMYFLTPHAVRYEIVKDINILLNSLDDSKLKHITQYIQLLNNKDLIIKL